MKFRKFGQVTLAAVVSLVLMFGANSCTNDFTAAFVFTVGTQYNQIGFLIRLADAELGAVNRHAAQPITKPTIRRRCGNRNQKREKNAKGQCRLP